MYELVTLDPTFSLYQNIAAAFDKQLLVPQRRLFADGECEIILQDPAQYAHKQIFLLHGTYPPVHTSLLELVLVVHALRNAGAQEVILVMPYCGYARHDKSSMPGKPPAAAIAGQLEAAGIAKIIAVELHNPAITAFFTIPMHHITMHDLLADAIAQQLENDRYYLVAPDKGAQKRVESMAKRLQSNYAILEKERIDTDMVHVASAGILPSARTAIIVDDIINTGQTALQSGELLEQKGFDNVYGFFVHPVLSGDAMKKIEKSNLKKVFVCNTIPLQDYPNKVRIIEVSKPIVAAIRNMI